MFTMYVTIRIRLSDGLLVDHLECESAPGLRLDDGTKQKPLETASHISVDLILYVRRQQLAAFHNRTLSARSFL